MKERKEENPHRGYMHARLRGRDTSPFHLKKQLPGCCLTLCVFLQTAFCAHTTSHRGRTGAHRQNLWERGLELVMCVMLLFCARIRHAVFLQEELHACRPSCHHHSGRGLAVFQKQRRRYNIPTPRHASLPHLLPALSLPHPRLSWRRRNYVCMMVVSDFLPPCARLSDIGGFTSQDLGGDFTLRPSPTLSPTLCVCVCVWPFSHCTPDFFFPTW